MSTASHSGPPWVEKTIAGALQGFAAGFGAASLVAFGYFLYAGSLRVVVFDLGTWGASVVNAGLSVLFFVQHSAMVRQSFRRWLARRIPRYYLDAVYAIASGIVLLAVVLLWQESKPVLWSATGPAWWLTRAIFVTAVGIGIWGVTSLHGLDTFGLRAILHRFRAAPSAVSALIVAGPYRWVRHPMYLVVLMMIWAYPEPTVDRLLFNVLWTLWIVIGTVLEERDLCAEFGDEYRDYQRRVPMLLPLRLPRS